VIAAPCRLPDYPIPVQNWYLKPSRIMRSG